MKNILNVELGHSLKPVILEVINESHLHKGHLSASDNDDTHFKLLIVSNHFTELSRIERERKVHSILEKIWHNQQIHALSLKLFTEQEWYQTNKHYQFHPEILRAYDIRGIFDKDLKAQDAYFLGKAIAKFMEGKNLGRKIAVGFDGRLSSPVLNTALVQGLLSSKIEIMHIGLVPTPALYYATQALECDAGIMITGSHNPSQYNGFKIMVNGLSLFGDEIIELGAIAKAGKFPEGSGIYQEIDIKNAYIDQLLEKALGQVNKNLKIAWDPGNGATGEIIELLTNRIPAENILINTKIDGNFPAHHPDPTMPENLAQLIEIVKTNKCDFGIAFDGDGDRIGVVDSNGNILYGEQLLFILAWDLLKYEKGAKIIVDVKTSDNVIEAIKKCGGHPIMWKTGHSFIKAKMKEEKAVLGGEMSGHLFFGGNYYGFDDAIFAACKLINIISNQAKSTLEEIVGQLPQWISTPEIRVEVPEKDKFDIIEKLKRELQTSHTPFNDLDGIRVTEEQGWWLIRASNTQNILVVRCEAKTKEYLNQLIDKVNGLLMQIDLNYKIYV